MIVAGRIFIDRWRTGFAKFRNTKVQDLDPVTSETSWLQPDVVGLQISVNDSLLVSFMNCRTNLFENIHHPVERQTLLFGQDVAERTTVEVLHDEVSNPTVVNTGESEVSDVNNVWMA